MQKTKTKRPETPAEALYFQNLTTRYEKLGLCDKCAAQAAYGHQHGFSAVHPPCNGCTGIVADFPVRKPNGWRAHTRESSRGFAAAA